MPCNGRSRTFCLFFLTCPKQSFETLISTLKDLEKAVFTGKKTTGPSVLQFKYQVSQYKSMGHGPSEFKTSVEGIFY